jgi:DNA modification methylase
MPSATTKRSPARATDGAGALRLEFVDLTTLHRWPRNPKEHDLPAIRESFTRFGFVAPILVDEGTGRIVSGHGRLDALMALQAQGGAPPGRIRVDGKRWLVPVLRGVRFPSEGEAEAYLLADNQLTILGGWRDADLVPLLDEFYQAGNLAGTGFAAKDLDDVLRRLTGLENKPPQPDPGAHLDRAAEFQKKWKTARGQLWRAGDHRLLCADSTDPKAWPRLLDGRKAAMVFTDPPYGVDYYSASGYHRPMPNDDLKGDAFVAFLTRAFTNMAAHADPKAAWYVWHASATRDEYSYALKAAEVRELQYLIWAKPVYMVGTSDYRWAHEPCFYAAKADRRPKFYGGGTQETFWRIALATAHGPSVVVGAGMAVWDGKGSALYVTTRIPKTRRLRQIRLEAGGTPAWLHDERAQETVWEVAREGIPDHPTQKPTELGRRAMLNSSQAGEVVVDGFAGSGSMLVAAEQTGRHGYGIEYDPGYVAVALERLDGLGLQPKREAGSG